MSVYCSKPRFGMRVNRGAYCRGKRIKGGRVLYYGILRYKSEILQVQHPPSFPSLDPQNGKAKKDDDKPVSIELLLLFLVILQNAILTETSEH